MEWCPTPDGAPATQYIALACHRGVDDQHYANKMYSGPGLIQLWDVGQLEYNTRYKWSRHAWALRLILLSDFFFSLILSFATYCFTLRCFYKHQILPFLSIPCLCRPDSQPSLAYALAENKGFIWHLKWCPAGGWELPSCGRKVGFHYLKANTSIFDLGFPITYTLYIKIMMFLTLKRLHSYLGWVFWQLPPPMVWSPFTASPTLMLCTPTTSSQTLVRLWIYHNCLLCCPVCSIYNDCFTSIITMTWCYYSFPNYKNNPPNCWFVQNPDLTRFRHPGDVVCCAQQRAVLAF